MDQGGIWWAESAAVSGICRLIVFSLFCSFFVQTHQCTGWDFREMEVVQRGSSLTVWASDFKSALSFQLWRILAKGGPWGAPSDRLRSFRRLDTFQLSIFYWHCQYYYCYYWTTATTSTTTFTTTSTATTSNTFQLFHLCLDLSELGQCQWVGLPSTIVQFAL